MPVYRIPREHLFPHPSRALPSGLLGVGGDLEPERLLLAYKLGIFPWYSADRPILWWSPDPRMVLFLSELRVPRSLAKIIRRGDYTLTLDKAFAAVIDACATVPRPRQDGTWLTSEMRDAYVRLHELGWAHSCEAWDGERLVGGLYGVAIGRLFSGESMFAHAPDASKVAFVRLAEALARWGFPLVDCQVHTDHLARFGAREIPRSDYLRRIAPLVHAEFAPGRWDVAISPERT